MDTRAEVDPATQAWKMVFEVITSERPLRVPSVAAEFGMSPMGVNLFRILEPGTELPMSALAESAGCDASNVTGIVDRLEARGLIERRDSPGDRRVKLIALTGDGAQLREQVMDRLYEPPAAIARLSAADQRALCDILGRALTYEG